MKWWVADETDRQDSLSPRTHFRPRLLISLDETRKAIIATRRQYTISGIIYTHLLVVGIKPRPIELSEYVQGSWVNTCHNITHWFIVTTPSGEFTMKSTPRDWRSVLCTASSEILTAEYWKVLLCHNSIFYLNQYPPLTTHVYAMRNTRKNSGNWKYERSSEHSS
jgi:hypothetical protein